MASRRDIAGTRRQTGRSWRRLAASMLLLSGCAGAEIPEIPPVVTAMPTNQPAADISQPLIIDLRPVVLAIPTTRTIGGYRLALDCAGPYGQVYPLDLTLGRHDNGREGDWWRAVLPTTLRQAGAALAGHATVSPTVTLELTISDLRLDLCRHASLWSGRDEGETGRGYLALDWRARDAQGRPLAHGKADAVAELDTRAGDATRLLAAEAFSQSLRQVLATVRQQLATPPATPRVADAAPPERTVIATPLAAPLATPPAASAQPPDPGALFRYPPPFVGRIEQNAPALLAASVLVRQDGQNRLALVIGEAHEATEEQHAVLSASPLRHDIPLLVIDSRADSHPGQPLPVPATTSAAGFALAGFSSPAPLDSLPLSNREPEIGDLVYALTSPTSRLDPALDRGVISGRCPAGTDGAPRWQVDLPVPRAVLEGRDPARSGGLLLDASGNLLGAIDNSAGADHATATDPALSCFRPSYAVLTFASQRHM